MAKDPVCGMYVDETSASLCAEVRGTTYYFCSESCLNEFVAPEKEFRKLKLLLATSALLAIPILFLSYLPLASSQGSHYLMFALETPLQFFVGWRFYRGAYEGLRARTGNMDVLIALGTSAAWAYSSVVTFLPDAVPSTGVYFDSSAVIITLVLAGRFLEHTTQERASSAVRKLIELQPKFAHVVSGEEENEVPVERVVVGDLLRVRPGERIPADGVVTEGNSSVDQAAITGESIPVEKGPGDQVTAAAVNQSGVLLVKAEKVGQDTTLAQIVRLVESAQAGRAPIQRFADRVASYFVPLVVAVALLAGAYWYYIARIGLGYSLLAFVSVVIIACPCALGIATPAALLVGTSKGAQIGILIKSGDSLERAGRVDTVVFDKTGTLTIGRPRVTDVLALDAVGVDEIVKLAASVEMGSEHPISRAIVEDARLKDIGLMKASDVRAVPGQGIRGVVGGKTVLVGNRQLVKSFGGDPSVAEGDLLALEGAGKTAAIVYQDGVKGIIAVADQVRDSASQGLALLKAMGIPVVMLTGDNERTAAAIAGSLGIERFGADVRPDEKEKEVGVIQGAGRKVAMVGDGINDAPALARADVGIVMGGGTDVALESGGIILMRNDIRAVAAAIRLSRRTVSKIRQNLFWAFAYNAALIPVAAGVLVPIFGPGMFAVLPFLAAGAMALSSVTVIGNSLALFRFDPLSEN